MPDSTAFLTVPLVPAVDKASRALRALADARRPVGISELARTLDVSKGTMRQVLLTLLHHGLVGRGEDQRFSLGPGLRALVSAETPDLAADAQPALEALVAEFGETAILGIPEPPKLRLAAVAQPDSPFHVSARLNGRIPLNTGCHAKVLLRGRAIGYDDEAYVPGVRAVAAPVFDATGKRVACLMVVGFKARVDLRMLKKIGARTLDLALEIVAAGLQPRGQSAAPAGLKARGYDRIR